MSDWKAEFRPQLVKSDDSYQAVKEVQRSQRFWIYFRSGRRRMVDAYPLDIDVPADRPDVMHITGRNFALTLYGRNLKELDNLFAEFRVRALHEFNPDVHEEPPDGKPKIHRIEISERAEEAA